MTQQVDDRRSTQPRPDGELRDAVYAPWWRRAAAFVIDIAVVFAVLNAVAIPMGFGPPTAVAAAVETVGLTLYGAMLQSRRGRRNGQTLGQQLMKCRVVRDASRPITIPFGLVRQLLVAVLLWPYPFGVFAVILWGVNYLWPLWDRENRALHDILMKTHVVAVARPPYDPMSGSWGARLRGWR